uniref:Uncharacterized protein n=1 Tax=Brassica oleracea var. oleracea TaxID=109376 RepID=A0A0D3BST5_BRAOL
MSVGILLSIDVYMSKNASIDELPRNYTDKVLPRFFIYGFGYVGFSDLEDFCDDLPVSRLKYNALEDFQDDLPGSLMAESSHMSPFHNRSERLVFRSRADFEKSSDGVFFHINWSPSLSL